VNLPASPAKPLRRWALATAILGGLLGAPLLGASPAMAGPDQQATVDHALVTLQDLRHDKEFGNARQLLRTSRAVLIAPRIFKGAFFVGGEGGTALLMVRGAHGWSDPAFYTIGSASFGLQIGAKESELILFIRSERALEAVMRDKFKIGGDAGIAVATLGSDVQGATTANAGADIIAWASSSGAFAGISLDGSILAPQRDANESFYGRPVTVSDIVRRRAVSSPAAAGLVRALSSLG
jgi:lipid-binding SYLF domain-containing protein